MIISNTSIFLFVSFLFCSFILLFYFFQSLVFIWYTNLGVSVTSFSFLFLVWVITFTNFWIRNWSHISTHLVVFSFYFHLVVATSGAVSLQIILGLIWQDYSSSKYTSTDRVLSLMWCHIQDLTVTSFRAEKYSHLVSAKAASAMHLPVSVP